jgi:dTDP-glucose pyrophosphorylase
MSQGDEFQGVILAAGKGKRIQPFSHHTPKPLLPVLDRPLLVWQIAAMRDLGVTEIVIVIGHLGHHVVQALGDGRALGVKLSYVEQDQVLGIAHAVSQLDPYITRPFLLFLGDIFFETKDLGSMLELYRRDDVDAVLAVKVEKDRAALRRNFTVDLDDRGRVRRVIEKPRHPSTNLKGCGLYLFDTTIFDAVRRTPRTALRDEYELTDSIQIFIDRGYGVVPARVVLDDLNLSGPEDLLALNLHVMRKAGHARYLAQDAELAAGAEVEESVVMARARIEGGAMLRRCLVLPGETVRAGSYHDTIFAGGVELPCGR